MNIKDTLKEHIERWSDPGDYPSNAGSGPLPSYDYVEDIEGELTLTLGLSDLHRMFAWLLTEGYLWDVLTTDPPELTHGSRVTSWSVAIRGQGDVELTLIPEEFDGGDVSRYNEE